MKYVIVKTDQGVRICSIREYDLENPSMMISWNYQGLNEEYKGKPVGSYAIGKFTGCQFETIDEGIEPDWYNKWFSHKNDQQK